MKSVIGNTVLVTKFAYKTVTKDRPGQTPITQRESICYIKHYISKTESEQIVEVSVKADSRDPFVRSVGRSLAFKKAMAKMFQDKNLREKFGFGHVEFAQMVGDFHEQCPSSVKVLV